MKYIFSCIFLLFSLLALNAQQSARKLVKQAESAKAVYKYSQAAELYAQAWKQKKDKLEWRYQSGVAYLKAGSYNLAAQALAECTKMTKDHPMVNYYYGQALKQNEQYTSAINAFNSFLGSYNGEAKDKWTVRVKNDIQGCIHAQKLDTDNGSSLSASRLDDIVNTKADEFGPAFFTNDILYFSSAESGKNATILRSQRLSGDWLPAVSPDFPNMPQGHFCHGSLSPDHKRFYFTVCEGGKNWSAQEAKCDIYVSQKSGSQWSSPVKMREYIKMDGTTATHPAVVHIDDIEFIYFSTNRIGGKGGMDIWYTYRFLDTDDFDYALPQNAGPRINTPGDEITPFYDIHEKALYFSSNGHPTIGGFDIFKAKGEMENWGEVTWLTLPYNSSANDYYFVKTPEGKDEYLVSNRLAEGKINTEDDDIFHLISIAQHPQVKGQIFAENSREALKETEVSLFEIRKDGNQRLLQSRISMDGAYNFDLIPGKQFRIEVYRPSFQTGFYDFDTKDLASNEIFEKDFYLSAVEEVTANKNNPVYQGGIEEKANQGNSSQKKFNAVTNNNLPTLPNSRRRYTPVHQGTYYKVQISATDTYDEKNPNLRRVSQFGRVDLEYILEKGWIRVLLADYFTLEEAQHVMKQCRMLGYPDAFIVKYESGRRMQ